MRGERLRGRITLWQAGSHDEARERAAAEAPPRDGAEVFSLVRDRALPAKAHVDRFFDTGQERRP